MSRSKIPVFLLIVSIAALYGRYLWTPLVFDDQYFFDQKTLDYNAHLHFALRWLPFATFAWTAKLLGLELVWLHLGNLLLHAGNCILIYFLLHKLFSETLPPPEKKALSYRWLAFFGALWFALHPVSVYATQYLVQRSMLFATFFSLLSLLAYLKGLPEGKKGWFLASAACYLLAVFSKEHAVMLPAVVLAATLLYESPSKKLFSRIAFPYFFFFAIGILVILLKRNLLGVAYEPYAGEALANMPERSHAYLLSVMTQCLLFFKYLFLWIVPSPAWLSVDMREPVAESLSDWRYLAASLGFLAYGLLAVRLLFYRGKRGLLGFALFFPWILFPTELSAIHFQEPFVLYRSYLWMAGFPALLPIIFHKMERKSTLSVLLGVSIAFVPISINRLETFRTSLALWDDAAVLIQARPGLFGEERIYHNRGNALARAGLMHDALKDYDKAMKIHPDAFLYNDRGAAYYYLHRYPEALADYDRSIRLLPGYARPYLGRGWC
ncbi:MAG: tetratricopeptide repeat protein [Burkholderiales bacterium]|nr:tetratricopeptide repeat protein [Burkholderiales bacterium]